MSDDTSPVTSPAPAGNLRWKVAFLIFLATTINYVDRQTLSVAAPAITEEFGLSAQQYGNVVSAFLLAYAIMQAISGRLIDWIGVRKGFSIAIVWWSIANMLHALSVGARSLMGFRVLLGVGEAANYPAAVKAIAKWFPRSERSMAVGILNAGPGLGSLIAPPLIAWLIIQYGWRGAFIVTGAVGFLWLFAWLRVYHDLEDHPRVSAAERSYILSGQDASSSETPSSWLELLRYREVWGVALARFVGDGAFYFIVFWLPKYLSDERGFSIAQIGLFAWIPFLASDIGSLYGGWQGKRWIDGGRSVNQSRKLAIWIGAVGVSVVAAAYWAPSAYGALAFIAVAMFFTQFKSSSLFALPADLFHARNVAAVWGLSGAAGSFGGMLFQQVVGYMVDNVSYAPVFVLAGTVHVVSALIITTMVPKVRIVESG